MRKRSDLNWEEAPRWGGSARAHDCESQDWINLERARVTPWILQQRHWPEEPYLHEFMTDL